MGYYRKYVRNLKELEDELNKRILESMKDIGKKGEKTLKEYIQTDVYLSYTPNDYKRTYDLLNSSTNDVYQVGSFTNAEIYNDYKVMRSVAPYSGNNYLGQHHSTVRTYEPQDYAFWVAATINDGTSGKIFGDGPWTKPRPFFTHTKDFMFRNFYKDLKNGLVYRGLSIK
jgi:hypothetical protein